MSDFQEKFARASGLRKQAAVNCYLGIIRELDSSVTSRLFTGSKLIKIRLMRAQAYQHLSNVYGCMCKNERKFWAAEQSFMAYIELAKSCNRSNSFIELDPLDKAKERLACMCCSIDYLFEQNCFQLALELQEKLAGTVNDNFENNDALREFWYLVMRPKNNRHDRFYDLKPQAMKLRLKNLQTTAPNAVIGDNGAPASNVPPPALAFVPAPIPVTEEVTVVTTYRHDPYAFKVIHQ